MKILRYTIIIIIIFSFTGCTNNFRSSGKNGEVKNPKVIDTNDIIDKVNEYPSNSSQEASGIDNPEPSKRPQKEQKTDAEAVGKIVVIDPGHANRSNLQKEPNAPDSTVMKIKDGGGAAGVRTKTPEYLINMEVSIRLKKLLEEQGFKIIMTKTEHSQSLGNVERAEIGNKAKADLVIRIHCDSNISSSAVGASMLVPQAVNSNTKVIYEKSRKYGEIVLNTLTGKVGMKNRGLIFSKDMTGFNWSEVPVILVEMGFLSNPEEDKLLSSASYQDKLAEGLAEGIIAAFK